jgi:DNA replication initiation complex subunit (GINS family)
MTHERLQRFAGEQNMQVHIHCGLSINGLIANEFAHLLASVTNQAHRSFDNIADIAHDFYAIDNAIIRELQKPVSHDDELDAAHHAEHIQNLQKLRLIVQCIANFFKIAHELELSPLLEMATLDG